MEKDTNKCFIINESDELTKQKILNSILIKELRKYKEENTKLKHEKEKLNSIIEKLEEENKALKNDFSIRKKQNPHEETMQIVENILQSNNEIKEEPLDNYDLTKKYSECESCDNTFSDEEDLNMHMNVKHRNIGKFKARASLETNPAKIKQKKQKVVEEHFNIRDDEIKDVAEPSLSSVHEGQTKHKCETCGKLLATKEGLKNHMKSVHEKTKDHHCTICNKSFALLEYLTRHIKSAHDKIKNHKCNLCDQSFFALSDLKRHIAMVHNGEKEFKCDICQKLFPSKFNANRHIKEVHEGKKY